MRTTSLHVYTTLALVLAGAMNFPATGLTGCSSAQGHLPERLTVFYSNETENELYRCGCRTSQSGGLSRRATVIATKEDSPELLVDAGNFSAKRPGNSYDEFKSDYLLKIYDMLGYSALNVGPLEFNRGKAALLTLAERTGNHMISGNVADEAGELVLPAYTIADIDGLKVGITGLITEQFRPNADNPEDTLKTLEPIAAMDSIWEELKKKSDVQIVLSQLRDDEVSQLIKAFPEIDAIIGGPGWQHGTQDKPWEEASVVMAKVGTRGKFLGELTIDLDSTDRRNVKVAKFEGEVHELGDQIPENVEIEKVLEDFKERLRKGEVIQDMYEPHSAQQQFGYAGSIYCQECHAEIYTGWLRTRHAQAFQTLAQKGEQNNPGCLECHTVGYADPGGYAHKGNSYLLANVQCESCHGPGSDHMVLAENYKLGKAQMPTDWKIANTNTPQETCIQCHNPDNDPNWVGTTWPYDKMVAQIACSQWLKPQADVAEPAVAPAIDPNAKLTPLEDELAKKQAMEKLRGKAGTPPTSRSGH